MTVIAFVAGLSLGACIGLLTAGVLRHWAQRNQEDNEW